jgi:hypothetical protein
MSGPNDEAPSSNGVPTAGHETGVLAGLPHTRPQRSSARRDAARRTRQRSAQAEGTPERATARKPESEPKSPATATTKLGPDRRAKPRPDRPGTRAPRRARIRVVEEPVPRQGFACEEERASGPVQPPGGTELVGAAAEALGEVAKAGLATGERLLKDLLSLLPRG